jgi:hypothetical protein
MPLKDTETCISKSQEGLQKTAESPLKQNGPIQRDQTHAIRRNFGDWRVLNSVIGLFEVARSVTAKFVVERPLKNAGPFQPGVAMLTKSSTRRGVQKYNASVVLRWCIYRTPAKTLTDPSPRPQVVH